VRGSADQPLAHCAKSAAAHIRPVSGRPSWLPDCLLDQGRNVVEYPGCTPSRDAFAVSEPVLTTARRFDGASGCLHHACIAARLRVIPWLACMLYRSAAQSSVDEFLLRTLPKS
jgi:hypothetical protein